MKHRTFFLLIGLWGTLSLPSWGQMDDFAWGDPAGATHSHGAKVTGNRYFMNLLTSPNHFYHDTWLEGNIMTVNGEVIAGYNLRYDALHDELVAFNNRVNGMFVVDRKMVEGFTVTYPGAGQSAFRRLSIRGNENRDSYYEVVHEGKVLLLCRIRIIERQTGLYRNKFGKLDNRAFDLQKQYYLYGKGYDYKVLEAGRKAIMDLFPDRRRALRQFFRKYGVHDFSRESNALWIGLLDQEGFF